MNGASRPRPARSEAGSNFDLFLVAGKRGYERELFAVSALPAKVDGLTRTPIVRANPQRLFDSTRDYAARFASSAAVGVSTL
jgi:hypothetical protein